MIQVICPECKGKGKVPCPVCNVNKDVSKNIINCSREKENQENVDCKANQVSPEKKCEVCGGTGEISCTACMGGGIMDTNAFA